MSKKTAVFSIALLASVMMGVSAEAASWNWSSLGVDASEKVSSFKSDDFMANGAHMMTPYLQPVEGSTYIANINAAIAREKAAFQKRMEQDNETEKTEGWMVWHEGILPNPTEGTSYSSLTSIVLVEQVLHAGRAHGETYAKGLTFDGEGNEVTLLELLPDVTVDHVNKCIEANAKKKGINVFENAEVTELPDNFYVGKNHVVYVLFQQYDIAPYSEGVISIPVGKLS
ncbi:MAG: RsiV family protein [Dialister sp.]|nr:RsiV family protein [Dialister sp.]